MDNDASSSITNEKHADLAKHVGKGLLLFLSGWLLQLLLIAVEFLIFGYFVHVYDFGMSDVAYFALLYLSFPVCVIPLGILVVKAGIYLKKRVHPGLIGIGFIQPGILLIILLFW